MKKDYTLLSPNCNCDSVLNHEMDTCIHMKRCMLANLMHVLKHRPDLILCEQTTEMIILIRETKFIRT